MILIKSALERSRGLSRRTLSHESSHDNDTKCRPRDLGPPRDGGALITILRARAVTPAGALTRCPLRALSQLELPFSPPCLPLALRAASISIDTRSMLHFAPIAVTAGRPLSSIAFAFVRLYARAERLLMSRDSSAEMMMTGDRARE